MKKIIINTIISFIICAISHFVYDIIPSPITAIFFPVNESIWEHLKLVFTSGIIFSLLERIKYKEKNFLTKAFLRSTLLILILSFIYIPIYYIFGEILILTLIILLISILLTETIIKKIPIHKSNIIINSISLILLITCYLIFYFYTYNPPKQDLFYDHNEKKYGLNQ